MLVARQVYYELGELDPRKRTIPNLRKALSEKAKNGELTASRNNQKLTDWRRDYAWEAWCAKQDEANAESRMEKTRQAAERALSLMSLGADDVVEVMMDLIKNTKIPPNVRAQMVNSYLDRIGAKALPARPAADVESDAAKPPPKPPENATLEEKQAWLAQVQRRPVST